MRGSAPAHTGAPGFGHECGIAPACILGHVVVQIQYGFVAVDVASRLVEEARVDHDRSIDRDQVVAQAIKETRAAVCAPVAVTRCVGKMGQQFLALRDAHSRAGPDGHGVDRRCVAGTAVLAVAIAGSERRALHFKGDLAAEAIAAVFHIIR